MTGPQTERGGTMLSRRSRLVVGAGILLASTVFLMLAARDAGAADVCTMQSPANCSANRLNIDIQANPIMAPNGSFVTYQVSVSNNPGNNPDACDVKGAFVTFCCPAANGLPEPGPTGCTLI